MKITIISILVVLTLCFCSIPLQSEENDEEDTRQTITLGRIIVNNENINIIAEDQVYVEVSETKTINLRVNYEITASGLNDRGYVAVCNTQAWFSDTDTETGWMSFSEIIYPGYSRTFTLKGIYYDGWPNEQVEAIQTKGVTIIGVAPPNSPPNKPSLSGPTAVKVGESGIYRTNISDPDRDMMNISWNWGSGGYTGLEGPYISGITIDRPHTWTESDLERSPIYIRVKADDGNGGATCSDPLRVTVSKNNDNDSDNESSITSKLDAYTELQLNELTYNDTIQYSQNILLQLLATEPIIIQYENI